MLVTIITPCFNSEKTIARTIESVLNQIRPVDEYLIIDGASTDKTLEIIKSYEKLFEGRMKIVSEPDQGIYDAMNKGIKLATGELIGIVNSDDYFEPDAVKVMVENRTNDDYQILYGYERIWENGQEIKVVLNHHNNIRNQMITHPTCFVTKKIYDDKGLFNTNYKYSADYEFMLRMSEDKDVIFTPIYEIISNYALGGASGTAAAFFETQDLLYQYGSISKKRYRQMKIKSAIVKLLRL